MENELQKLNDAELFKLAGVSGYPEGVSVADVDTCSTREMRAAYGMTRRQSQKAKAIMEVAKRWICSTVRRGAILNHSAQAFDVFRPLVCNLKQEVFLTALLDSKSTVLDVIEISRGSLTSSLVHPREVFRPAIKHGAASVICAHNHPSGDPKPSKEDRHLTERLHAAGEQIGIQFLDHLIIGESRYLSFCDEGWLAPSKLF